MFKPGHNQAVERHIKVVSDAASSVRGPDRWDGITRQKLWYNPAEIKVLKTHQV